MPSFLHTRKHRLDMLDVGDAGLRVRGRARRIELDAMDKSGILGAIDLLGQRVVRQVQRHQRFEAAARGQRRHDALAVGAGQRGGGNGGLKIRHYNGATEAFGREAHDRIQGIGVAQVHVPVIRPQEGQAIHAADCAGQPRRSRSSV